MVIKTKEFQEVATTIRQATDDTAANLEIVAKDITVKDEMNG